MLKKAILLLVLIWAVTVFSAAAQTTLIFVGKIEEVATKTQMTGMGSTEKYLSIKLDSKPKLDFRITARDAARFGLTDTAQPSAVITPGKIKGVGWKVRLTCDKKTTLGDPIYMVLKLERLD
ncbi:MAG: hypothetical protein A2Z73_06440 [Deltaproteobacteria bacterium RBG_13_60_28]|nr:MAG: hypothetical protein A2Z73_06440 [Deltaproteobacteria bacterium RBG_13_60_28]